ncbi:carboxypeptidase-like regulatory domain-containing protein [Galbibacter sp. EGI 63066]|uniref:TonB-dependent receptor n=1 Tax=Galbibacter sp. EGI 63066 TaxID=2993559 RepID=UPI002248D804|nr:carboxypeptidase-like regulatory domain-containing protein [Galbibacter sp. EGI 63066]MCX2678579.1 carboxypeptidase-like regulatory domain-containing protein [Galbibacter sp. EGI 63066]
MRGVVLDQNNSPIEGVIIRSAAASTTSNENGFYQLLIKANEEIIVEFSHLSYQKISLSVVLNNGEDLEFNPIMQTQIEQIGEVVVVSSDRKTIEGIQNIPPEIIRSIPGANAGVENILKSLPGVNSNNELSTQYSVRGGNYDENLVYVNEIEVYRPFLIRSGQQEGMSFINSDLIQDIDFSAGGFQAKYGDKLSSVLDVTYKTPTKLAGGVNVSLLGGSAYLETSSKDNRFTSLSGVRYRNNSLFVNSKQTESNYQPVFTDAQTYLRYKFSGKFQLDFLGNIALNEYNYEPISRQTNFGTFDNPMTLRIDYEGEEEDSYKTAFGAFKGSYTANQYTSLKFIGSLYHTTEKEYYDLHGRYRLGTMDTENGGVVTNYENIGSQIQHARNDLKALIFNLQHKGIHKKDGNSLEWGVKYTHEHFNDRLEEYEMIDSTGFASDSVNADYGTGNLAPFRNINAENKVNINRLSAYTQWSRLGYWGNNKIWINAGLRAQLWQVSGENIESNTQVIISPRAQFSIKPNWEKDMLFRIAGGIYSQPPFYRELRDSTGLVNPEVKAQKSYHVVLGHDYSFKLWERPFKLTTELYHKYLDDVNPYTLENVRIRYQAENNATAYVYGIDLRLNGEFVPGTESWVSFGYLKTEENIEDKGYIARPTDQRLKFAILFQDYVPNIPNLKLYLNGVYNTGVPGGSPNYADPYDFQFRLPDYKRMDVGISYVLIKPENQLKKKALSNKFKEIHVGFEIFNIFDIQNSITNTWVRDNYTQNQYAIPNYMTGRIFNIKAGLRF